ncbi:MAG TPA: DNA gyrase subunit A, partial [bacterium]|nr:DNA gyrase subunit A [bacterium]
MFAQNERIRPVNIEEEMKVSYISYAMSVIVSRALPDVRDGLKPVHRRVIFSMHELGLGPSRPYRKSAKIVGETMGKYHPHGDSAIYDSLVRMAQDFSIRYPVVDGQGNFGSVDGDPPAAMRYTEARLSRVGEAMLTDIDKETVDFIPNFDESEMEPTVLPSVIPNLLVNGSAGIAVGMATNIPPHNLVEVVDAVLAQIDNPDITTRELMALLPGPDFPTGATICGRQGILDAYETGRGRVVQRATAVLEQSKAGKQNLIVTEIPYMVNKANLIREMADLIRDKRIEGIADLRDESDRDGMRIVIELKRGENYEVVLNQLYKHTKMQNTFGVILLALVDGRPVYLSLKEIIDQFIKHRREVITRRTRFLLAKAEARAHILEGLRIALDNIDAVVALIRKSADAEQAKTGLMNKFKLSDKQAQAILDMRLQRLTGLEREKLEEEYRALLKDIEYYKNVLSNAALLTEIMKTELREIKERFGDDRRTKIVEDETDLDIEDLIAEENMVVTVSHQGYIKRISTDTYRQQKRGGRGIIAVETKETDFVEQMFIASTHHYVLFFTNQGRVYWQKVYALPQGGRATRGKAIVNLLEL